MARPKATLLESLPRVGVVNLAQLLAEVGPILDRAADVEHASSEIGATPVTRESGRSRTVHFRWAANTGARRALGIFADNSRHASPWAAQLYQQARSRGQRHPQAIRVLMRAWLRVIWACWQTDTAYNPARHGAERRLAQQHSKETAA
jgi:transposase